MVAVSPSRLDPGPAGLDIGAPVGGIGACGGAKLARDGHMFPLRTFEAPGRSIGL